MNRVRYKENSTMSALDRIMKELDEISPTDTAALLRLTRKLVRYAKSVDELDLEERELMRQLAGKEKGRCKCCR